MFPAIKNRVYTTPYSGFNSFFDDLQLRDLFNPAVKSNTNSPSTNVKETKDKFIIELAVPGMSKSDFAIKVEDKMLRISSEKAQENIAEGERYKRKEFSFGKFTRAFTLPETVDASAINAEYVNGILLVTLPKRSEEVSKKAHEIEVK